MNYAALSSKASSIIAKFGKPAKLRLLASETNPATRERTAGWEPDIDVSVVEDAYKASQIDGSIVLAGDRKFLMAADGVASITRKHKLVVGGQTLAIVNFEPVQPGAVVLCYVVQCRG